ncbi:MAG: hypothetical protein QOD77_1490 [Thermoplasmata archaeon]|jgi:hypothetical protein|nr:hypothetical protein [Thermoplasmata archaeon]
MQQVPWLAAMLAGLGVALALGGAALVVVNVPDASSPVPIVTGLALVAAGGVAAWAALAGQRAPLLVAAAVAAAVAVVHATGAVGLLVAPAAVLLAVGAFALPRAPGDDFKTPRRPAAISGHRSPRKGVRQRAGGPPRTP